MVRQFFIFGHYGEKNTGDDAMVYALLRELQLLDPTSTFVILSQIPIMVPREVENSIKFIKAVPRIVFREIMKSSDFIMGGGTQIYDYDHGDRIKRLKIMSKMFILLMFAKIFCRRIYLLGIGIEPLSTGWGKLLSKKMCGLANFISVRDTSSYNILKNMRLENKVVLSFDLATLLLSSFNNDHERLLNSTDDKILGISILPFFEIYHDDKESDRIFVHEIAKGLNQWLKKDKRSIIHLFIFKGKSRADDVLITRILQKQLESTDRVKLVQYDPNPIEMLRKVAKCHAFVGMRYHSCMFAYLTNTPMLVINYFQKCQALAEDIGLSKDAVVSIDDVLSGGFQKKLQQLQEHPDDFIAALSINEAKHMTKKTFEQIW